MTQDHPENELLLFSKDQSLSENDYFFLKKNSYDILILFFFLIEDFSDKLSRKVENWVQMSAQVYDRVDWVDGL